MAELFGIDVRTVNEHLQNIFSTGELDKDSVIRNFRITATDGKNYNTQFYNLDAIIAVGYRVNSYQATQFRIWATQTLKDFIIKGFVLSPWNLRKRNMKNSGLCRTLILKAISTSYCQTNTCCRPSRTTWSK